MSSFDSIVVGNNAATGNVLRVNSGGSFTDLIGLRVGNGTGPSGSRAIIDGGTVFAGLGPGWATPGVYINGGTDNQVVVQNGGVLDSYLLSVAAGAGNCITNSGGIYQFNTVTPTITTNGAAEGSIFINGGTISYRGVTSGLDMEDHLSSQLN